MYRKLLIAFIAFGVMYNAPSYAEVMCVVNTCNIGYYATDYIMDAIDGSEWYLQCRRCPAGATSRTGATVYGTTDVVGRNLITACKLPAGQYRDDTGEYEIIAGGCQYKY